MSRLVPQRWSTTQSLPSTDRNVSSLPGFVQRGLDKKPCVGIENELSVSRRGYRLTLTGDWQASAHVQDQVEVVDGIGR